MSGFHSPESLLIFKCILGESTPEDSNNWYIHFATAESAGTSHGVKFALEWIRVRCVFSLYG